MSSRLEALADRLAALQERVMSPGPRNLSAVSAELAEIIHSLQARLVPWYDRRQNDRVDYRRSIRESVRQPFMPPTWYRSGRERRRSLAVLIDASESMEPYAGWTAVVLSALARSDARLAVFRFNHRLEQWDLHGLSPTRIRQQLARFSRPAPVLDCLALPRLLQHVRSAAPQCRDALLVSDLVVSDVLPDVTQTGTWLTACGIHVSAFEHVMVLDPMDLEVPASGRLDVTLEGLKPLLERLGRRGVEGSPPGGLRSSESRDTLSARRLSAVHHDAIIGRITVARPHFEALSRSAEGRGVISVAPRATLADLVAFLARHYTGKAPTSARAPG